MGQSASRAIRRPSAAPSLPTISIFPTNLGWFGLLGNDSQLAAVWIGHSSEEQVRRAARQRLTDAGKPADAREHDWNPELRIRLERYAVGERGDFKDVALALPRQTEFQRRIIAVTRQIRYGQTISYGDLAARAGFPRAARAVGSVMSSNQFPIVVPCHRVVAAGNKLGGYTSPQGVCLKERLLALEAG